MALSGSYSCRGVWHCLFLFLMGKLQVIEGLFEDVKLHTSVLFVDISRSKSVDHRASRKSW